MHLNIRLCTLYNCHHTTHHNQWSNYSYTLYHIQYIQLCMRMYSRYYTLYSQMSNLLSMYHHNLDICHDKIHHIHCHNQLYIALRMYH